MKSILEKLYLHLSWLPMTKNMPFLNDKNLQESGSSVHSGPFAHAIPSGWNAVYFPSTPPSSLISIHL